MSRAARASGHAHASTTPPPVLGPGDVTSLKLSNHCSRGRGRASGYTPIVSPVVHLTNASERAPHVKVEGEQVVDLDQASPCLSNYNPPR
uniref:Uncharacterized protein n=1 Tax=Arundo donax TaxID=35708 RepID=A0A0A9GKC3_ARUDO